MFPNHNQRRSLFPRIAAPGLAALGLLATLGGCGDGESKSMDFALVWDGYDLIRQMSRRVPIL